MRCQVRVNIGMRKQVYLLHNGTDSAESNYFREMYALHDQMTLEMKIKTTTA